jgi:hypothetical protein
MIEWKLLPEWVNYIGIDNDGIAYAFEFEPSWNPRDDIWYAPTAKGVVAYWGRGQEHGMLHERERKVDAPTSVLKLCNIQLKMKEMANTPKPPIENYFANTIWDNAPVWANWIACDSDNTAHWYEMEPSLHYYENFWYVLAGQELKAEGVAISNMEKIGRM